MFKQFYYYIRSIKIEHTVFMMPFAIISAFFADNGMINLEKFKWIILAMIFARSAAMGFNRLIDAKFDKLNARTKNREIPTGKLSVGGAVFFIILFSILFVYSSYELNLLSFILSIPALAIIFFYSYTKKFTAYSHLFLGLALSIAPVGAWIAIRGTIELPAIFLAISVILWTSGFDIIYSCQDMKFDKEHGLYSIPVKYGIKRALNLSSVLHLVMIAVLYVFGYYMVLEQIYFVSLAIITCILFIEHILISEDNLSRVDVSFFTLNGIISVVFAVMTIIDVIY